MSWQPQEQLPGLLLNILQDIWSTCRISYFYFPDIRFLLAVCPDLPFFNIRFLLVGYPVSIVRYRFLHVVYPVSTCRISGFYLADIRFIPGGTAAGGGAAESPAAAGAAAAANTERLVYRIIVRRGNIIGK